MELGQVAQRFRNLKLDTYQLPGGTWQLAAAVAKLYPADRFLTLYSAPLHLRMMGLAPGDSLPASRVVRVSGTPDVYLLGQPRDDVDSGGAYDRICNARLVTGQAGGIYTVHRKSTQGTGLNLGPLIDGVVGAYYGDAQFFSLKREEQVTNGYVGDFHVLVAATADIRGWDFLVGPQGKVYRVLEPYFESGFLLCRVLETVDTRVDVTYKTNTIQAYVPGAETQPTVDPGSYVITGYFGALVDRDGSSASPALQMEFYVEAAHIGFTPTKQGQLVYESKTLDIVEVSLDSAKRQWCFKCKA